MTPLDELAATWYGRANDLSDYAPAAAAAFRRAANELEHAMRANRDEVLNLAEAAATTGYSRDHLAREIRRGKLANVGRKGAPRVRRGDLPRKLRLTLSRDEANVCVASKGQIARSVVTSERGKHDG